MPLSILSALSLTSSYKFLITVVFKASVFFVSFFFVWLQAGKKANAIPRVPLWEMTDLTYIRLFCDKRVIESHSVWQQTSFLIIAVRGRCDYLTLSHYISLG